ncbi:MAG: DUF1800 domain-containing protein [Rhodobacteraceae bacterium]|nr:DUF1800 domain-containing protein [Paracoccaceae bacterium]
MTQMDSFHALHRFGFGPAPGEMRAVASDPRAWVAAQIGPTPAPPRLAGFAGSDALLTRLYSARFEGNETYASTNRDVYRNAYLPEILARAEIAVTTARPFAERMVMFWSNHFTVSRLKPVVGNAAAAYEREAIRPHVFGRFADMLRAVVQHPVMLTYLDNTASMGEQSPIGLRRQARRGDFNALNENLAREILELHTLGVTGGYDQTDVIELAKVLTGWSVGGIRMGFERNRPRHGGFEFKPMLHEPGPKTVVGRRYRENGEQEGIDALNDLARHPSTAQFIATKLARHFLADDPPDSAVRHLAQVFAESDGDLGEVAQALVSLDLAWTAPPTKIKPHYDYVIAVLRAMDTAKVSPRDVYRLLRNINSMPFTAPSPAGWGDRAEDWLAPAALMARIEWVRSISSALPHGFAPNAFLEALIGPVANAPIQQEVARAPSGPDAMALVLASAEFQRR